MARERKPVIILQGNSGSAGIAFGELRFYHREDACSDTGQEADAGGEFLLFEEARLAAIGDLDILYKRAVEEIGGQEAQVFEIHKMMLEDEDFILSVKEIITNKKASASRAVWLNAQHYCAMFSDIENDYIRERVADIWDISRQMINVLHGRKEKEITFAGPVILAAPDFLPGETIRMDKSKVLSLVAAHGTANSHTAILARAMGIPSVFGVRKGLNQELEGRPVIVDGGEGRVYIDPDEETIARMKLQQEKENERVRLLKELKDKPDITLDGKKIKIYANVGSAKEAEQALENGAAGIGLFRSEFMFLGRGDYPCEDEQFAIYKSIAREMQGKRIVFRTLDIGADKQAPHFNLPKEENPQLGLRGARVSLARPELLKTQLRAIYRVSAFGNAAILFPMITKLWELDELKAQTEKIKQELRDAAIPFDENVALGIMIETPAAAIISDLLAMQVDFFSIGTNDLTQYTLAADRHNPEIQHYYDAGNTAVMRLIEMTVQNAKKAGIRVNICGELAADLSSIEKLLKMGVEELSVSPHMILALRDKIRRIRADD